MTFPTQTLSFFNSEQYQIKYDTPGTYQFTVPEGVSSLSGVVIGAGGGGAGSDATNSGSGGGGGGGTTWAVFGVQPGDVLTITVGTGGTGGNQVSGLAGGTSSIRITSRIGVGAIDQTIIQALGGGGGIRIAAGTGGSGGTGNSVINNVYCPIYLNGGGTGGSGGTGTGGASGGGGAGGYNGNGGNGGNGSVVGVTNPTAAVTNSGGGGGGGGSASGLGYGGGGTGSFGFSGTGQGAAGVNNSSGGGGASYFIDPSEGIIADLVGQSISTTNTISYPTGIAAGDVLLLLSGSDATGGLTDIPVPIGFTTISQSNSAEYYTSGNLSSNTGITDIVPSGVTPPTRDLNFTSSYRTVPEGSLSGSIGIASTAIHNMIALRGLPIPISISWATDSGDPGVAPFATLMPNPPPVTGIGAGALAIALGFLANTTLNPSANSAGANTIGINTISGGILGGNGQGIGLVASYIQTTATGSYNPDAFLTGTASHARAYSLQINRSVSGTPVSVVGSAVTANLPSGTGFTFLNLPAGVASGDLLVYICANDNPASPNAPVLALANGTAVGGFTWVNVQNGNSTDGRGTGGLGYRVGIATYGGTGTRVGSTINPITAGNITTPAAHMVIAFRGATSTSNFAVWDNGADAAYGPPDPPALTTTSANALLLAIGMVDNITISNVTTVSAPTGYTMLAQQSYGIQNNGVIIMSAYKSNLTAAASEDPTNFGGGGGNIWASQTLIIGGPETQGTQERAGLYGGGGGSWTDGTVGSGMDGAQGSARIIWGTGRRYPSSNQANQSLFDSVP
jgi:hypothetical protein